MSGGFFHCIRNGDEAEIMLNGARVILRADADGITGTTKLPWPFEALGAVTASPRFAEEVAATLLALAQQSRKISASMVQA
jgi:hypothetical protein